ncbi:MAG TPA: GAF domain-containing protein, partial [Armatimonadota bacterium]|nr:GAF domain-containing protein [Armatimonadota bacterium]
MPVSQQWRRWRRFVQRHIDLSGLVYLTVALLTIAIVSATRSPLLLCLLLLLPIALLAVFIGWGAGVMGGMVAALLTAPGIGSSTALLRPPLDPVLWVALALAYLLFGVLLGIQGQRAQRERHLDEIEEKLAHARVSAARYEAMLEEMSEGQAYLTRMNEELAILNTIATAVNSSLEVGQVQATAMALLGTLLNVDEVLIYWINDTSACFELQAARPLSEEAVAQAPAVPLDAGVLGRLVTSQRAEAISEASGDMALRPPSMSAEIKSLIAIPLRSRARLFGALVLGRRSGRSFSDDDEKFLGSVGRVLALAIENATLFRETQELSLVDELTGLYNRRGFLT